VSSDRRSRRTEIVSDKTYIWLGARQYSSLSSTPYNVQLEMQVEYLCRVVSALWVVYMGWG